MEQQYAMEQVVGHRADSVRQGPIIEILPPVGGLVRLGEPAQLRRHIAQALELVQLYASDPLCSEHDVNADAATLHGAACLFVPETSCERGNRYLDRATLVPTFTGGDSAFFHPEPIA